MPRRTPVREIKAEDTAVVDSPRRRSSRIAAVTTNTSTPTPAAKVATRRSSASETPTQPARVTRRLSLSQDTKGPESPVTKNAGKSPTTLLKESNLKSTPAKLRGRRGSKSTEDENTQPPAAETAKAADPPRRTTRRNSISTLEKIQETESPKPVRRLTRRRSSATEPPQLDKIAEGEPEKDKNTNMETISENAEEPEENVKIDDEVFMVNAKVEVEKKEDDVGVTETTVRSEKVNRLSLKKETVEGVEKTEEKETRKSLNAGKSPVIKLTRKSLESVEVAEVVTVDEEIEKSNNTFEVKETRTSLMRQSLEKPINDTEDNEVTLKPENEDSIETTYNKLKQIILKTTPQKTTGTKLEVDDEDVQNLHLNITEDSKKLNISGNSDKENTNSNISKTPDVKKFTENVIISEQIVPSSPVTTVLRAQVEEPLFPQSPAAKRKSLTESPTKGGRSKSASPAFSVTAEIQSDDDVVVESPAKRRKSEINGEETTEKMDVETPQDAKKEEVKNSPKASVDSEDAEIDVVEDSEAEEDVKIDVTQKPETPKKNDGSVTMMCDEECKMEEQVVAKEETSTPSPRKSNIDNVFNTDENISKIKILDDTPITDNPVDIDENALDELKTKEGDDGIIEGNDDITEKNDSITEKNDSITQETEDLLNTSFSKKNNTADDEDETMDQDLDVPQDDEKASNKSLSSQGENQEANDNEFNGIEDKETIQEEKEDPKNLDTSQQSQKSINDELSSVKETAIDQNVKTPNRTRKSLRTQVEGETKNQEAEDKEVSLNASQLSSSSKKSRKSLKSDNQDNEKESSNTVNEDTTNLKKTSAKNEDLPEENAKKTSNKTRKSLRTQEETQKNNQETEDEEMSLNASQLSNSSKKSRRSLTSNSQDDEEEASNIVSEDATNLKKTPAKNEDLPEENSKKTPNKTRKSLRTQEESAKKNQETEDKEVSLNASQLSNSSKKSRRSLKSDNQDNEEEPSEEISNTVNEDTTNLKKTPARNEDLPEKNSKKTPKRTRKSLRTQEETQKKNQETEDKEVSLNASQLSNSLKKSRKSLKSDNQDNEEETVSENTINSKKTPARTEDLPEENPKKTPKKSRKSLNVSQLDDNVHKHRKSLQPEYDDDENATKTPNHEESPKKKSRKSSDKRRSLKKSEDLDDDLDSEIDESEMAEIVEFLGKVSGEDQQKSKRRSSVEKEFERYERDDKSEKESPKKKKMTVIDTADNDELDAQVSAYLKQKAEEMFSSDDSEDDDYRPKSDFVDDEAMEVDDEESDVSADSNEIEFEGESLNSSDTETDGDEEEETDDSFICDDEDVELLSGNEDFLEDKSPKKKVKKSRNDGKEKYSRIINNDSDDAAEEPKKPNQDDEKLVGKKRDSYSRIIPNIESDSEDETPDTKPEDEENAEVPPQEMEASVIKVDDSDNEDEVLSSTVKVDPNESRAESTQERRKSVRKSSMSVQENISLQDIDDGDLSQRITKVVEWFYTGIKSNADMSGNISLNVSLDYCDKKNEDEEKRTSIEGAIEVATDVFESPAKKRKSTEAVESVEVLNYDVSSPNKKRKSSGTVEITSPQKKVQSPEEKRSENLEETVDIPSTSPQKKVKTKPPGEQEQETIEIPLPSPVKKSKSPKKATPNPVESINIESKDEPIPEALKSPDNLQITIDRKERVVTRKQKKQVKPKHNFEETPIDGQLDQLRSIMEFKQLKMDGLDDWNKTESIVKPSVSEEPEEARKKRSNRKPRMVKPSVSMGGDNEWITEEVSEATASLSMPKIKKRKGTDAGSSNVPSFHPKDFKNQVIHAMGRVPRMDTKILLRKRKV